MKTKFGSLAGKRIGIFGKGGCGKSTVTILLAKVLRERGYPICVLDADSTNVGLHLALGIDHAPYPLLDYFGGMVFSGGAVTCPVDDPTPLAGGRIALRDLPNNYVGVSQEGIRLLTVGKIGDKGPGAGCDGPISKIARDFRINDDLSDGLTLVDFKAGFEDSARGAITTLDWVIVVVDPTLAAVQMAANMCDMVARIGAGELPATEHLENRDLVEKANRMYRQASIQDVYVVLNRVYSETVKDYLYKLLADEGIEPIGVIHENEDIAQSWMLGTPLEVWYAEQEAYHIAERLDVSTSKRSGASELALQNM